jgi:hypothetical protein
MPHSPPVTLRSGKAYNIGGGPNNVLSLLELLAYIEKRQNREPM